MSLEQQFISLQKIHEETVKEKEILKEELERVKNDYKYTKFFMDQFIKNSTLIMRQTSSPNVRSPKSSSSSHLFKGLS